MRLVKTADIKPHRCAVLPQIGEQHPDGYIDTGSELPSFDNHVYISVVAVREMARMVGLPDERVAIDLASAQEQIELLEAEVERLNKVIDSTAVLKNSRLYVAERKPGRPPKTQSKKTPEVAA